MGRFIVSVALAVVFCTGVAWGQVAELGFGQIEVGGMWQPQVLKADLASLGRRDIELSTYAVGIEAGLIPGRLSLFGAVGTGDAHLHGLGIDGNIDHYWQGGFRVTAWHSGPWSAGLTVDAQQWKIQDSTMIADRPMGARLNVAEYRVRPTLAYQTGPVTFYGGPSVAWPDGSWTFFWSSSRDDKFRVHTTTEFGGFLGASWQVGLHVMLAAEGEVSEVGQSAWLSAGYRF